AVALLQRSRHAEDSVFALPTYTALFPLREILARQSGDAAAVAERRPEEASV
ncbi:MAG: DUF1727 domain-containing protein, partial [Desulfitobacteriaceae bacterium]